MAGMKTIRKWLLQNVNSEKRSRLHDRDTAGASLDSRARDAVSLTTSRQDRHDRMGIREEQEHL